MANKIEKVGLVGWRGMVGSVLLERMQAENDFEGLVPLFYTTSQVGQAAPDVGVPAPALLDAYDAQALAQNDVVISCQGGDYTKKVLPELRASGWKGYWIDAASAKRMDDDSVIVLDPINRDAIDRAIGDGCLNFIGGNCTVSLMMLGLHGLLERGWVEWITAMTYQAASGAGAQNMRELVAQMRFLGEGCGTKLDDVSSSALDVEGQVADLLAQPELPTDHFGVSLAASLIPWIDSKVEGGRTREEWKGDAEMNKILETREPIPVDGTCVRVGVMRCHSQAFTIKLRQDVPLDEIEEVIGSANDWVRVVANEKADTLRELSPAAVTGTLDIPVGRIRKLRMGDDYLGCFTVGDQLLWGAAEPLRRILRILREERG